MSDRPEHRQFRRYPIQLPLLHTPKGPTPAQPGVGWTRNLSEGGACVELAERLQSRLPLLVCLRTERGIIEAEAEVAWAEKPPLATGGILHGVAFTQSRPRSPSDPPGLDRHQWPGTARRGPPAIRSARYLSAQG